MKIGIFYHSEKAKADAANALKEQLSARGAEVELFSSEREIGGVDRLVVLGGDGSILRAARYASLAGIPIVGVNYGTIGFLAEFEREQTEELCALALSLKSRVLSRAMLEVEAGGKSYVCLNELTLTRRISPEAGERVVRILLEIDDAPAGEFRSDGLIVATPTGSTGYSLSAGGSIVTPDCAVFLLTPMCAVSLRSRPIVCSDKSKLTLSFSAGSTIALCGDGVFLGEVEGEDRVIVKKSQRHADFLVKEKNDFFRRLTEKIG